MECIGLKDLISVKGIHNNENSIKVNLKTHGLPLLTKKSNKT